MDPPAPPPTTARAPEEDGGGGEGAGAAAASSSRSFNQTFFTARDEDSVLPPGSPQQQQQQQQEQEQKQEQQPHPHPHPQQDQDATDDDDDITSERLHEQQQKDSVEFDIRQIDHYELLEEVGRGAQGVVHKCRDVNTNQIYAMKELKGMAGKLTSFLTEISIMKKLNHPNLTKLFKVYDAPHMSSSMYFVMDYVDGGPVMKDTDILTQQATPMSVDEAQVVFRQLIRALNYLHYNGIIHRDIKPSNILRDRTTGLVKLSDFGVSSLTSESKAAKIIGEDDIVYVGTCGTPAFLSPEGLGAGHDHAYHGRPADIWAAGVTLYVFLFGTLPFSDPDGDMDETIRRIMEEPLKFPMKPAVPKPVKDLLTRMLEKDPTKRATLSWISTHPWVDVGNWKKDGVSEVEKPTPQDTSTALSIPMMINRVRRTSSGMAKKLSHAAMSMTKGSARRHSAGGSSTTSQQLGLGAKRPSSVGSAEAAGGGGGGGGNVGSRLSLGSVNSMTEQNSSWKANMGGNPHDDTQPLLGGESSERQGLEGGGRPSSTNTPKSEVEGEEDTLTWFVRTVMENLCCLER